MSSKKEIFIIRHGETDFNRNGIVQGRGVDASLNETGRQQALAFFQAYRDHGFEKVFISSLKRTRETVDGFITSGYEWQIFPELDEINWGVFEGRNTTPAFHEEYLQIVAAWRKGELEMKTPGGESPLEIRERQQAFIRHLAGEKSRKILVCMHGRAMRILLCTLLKKALHLMDDFPHQNLSLYKLHHADEVFEMILFNNTDHLNGQA